MNMCFKDVQRLETIHEKLLTCTAILESSLQIATDCLEYCGALGGETEIREASCNKMRLCIGRLGMHTRAAELVRRKCERTSKLVGASLLCSARCHNQPQTYAQLTEPLQLSQILDFRNEEETISSSHTMRDMLKVLTDLGTSAQQESESLRMLSEQAQDDARFTKILTFIAMLYLPASLVAVSSPSIRDRTPSCSSCDQTVFSSNLIESVASDQTQEPQRFATTAQFWLFPVLALALTIVTLVPALLFQRLPKANTSPKGTSI